MGLVMVARFTFILGYTLSLIMINESYPVSVKSIALFMNGIAVSISFVVAQILFTLERVIGIHPFALIALFCLIIVLMHLPLEETLGVPVPNHVEEVEEKMKEDG